jgi:hypothetical protein
MTAFRSSPGSRGLPILIGTLAVSLAVLLGFVGLGRMVPNRLLENVYRDTVRKDQLVSSMRVNLLASAEAEKSAVMADTDQASQAFSEKAMQAEAEVEDARRQLGALVEAGKRPREVDLFREFSDDWGKYRQIDKELLPLAVQNTNLKAFGLSFGVAGQAVHQVETALSSLMDSSAASSDAARVQRLCCLALTATLKIYVLEAPHIAEQTDEKMSEMETAMKTLNEQATDSLDGLGELADVADKAAFAEAKAAYARFWSINSEVISLSRQNSNVRSLVMSLGQKRKVTAQCEDLLRGLQEAIRSTPFKATR